MLPIILTIAALTTLNSYAAEVSNDSFDKLMEQKTFKVQVSSDSLKEMKQASTLVISCVDFRLKNETSDFLNNTLKLIDDYDGIVMPGASLAVVDQTHPSWSESIYGIIEVLKTLHNIKRVVLLDHLNCGAYKVILGEDSVKTPDVELATHKKTLGQAKQAIQEKFPDLKIHTMIMSLDGTIENVQQ